MTIRYVIIGIFVLVMAVLLYIGYKLDSQETEIRKPKTKKKNSVKPIEKTYAFGNNSQNEENYSKVVERETSKLEFMPQNEIEKEDVTFDTFEDPLKLEKSEVQEAEDLNRIADVNNAPIFVQEDDEDPLGLNIFEESTIKNDLILESHEEEKLDNEEDDGLLFNEVTSVEPLVEEEKETESIAKTKDEEDNSNEFDLSILDQVDDTEFEAENKIEEKTEVIPEEDDTEENEFDLDIIDQMDKDLEKIDNLEIIKKEAKDISESLKYETPFVEPACEYKDFSVKESKKVKEEKEEETIKVAPKRRYTKKREVAKDLNADFMKQMEENLEQVKEEPKTTRKRTTKK